MNFAELKTRCWWAIDDNPTTPKEIDTTTMGLLINEAINDLTENLYLAKSATVSFTSGVGNLPADFYRPLELKFNDTVLEQIRSIGDAVTGDGPTTQFYIPDNATIRVYGSYTTATAPGAPTLADSGAAGLPNGTYLGKVTYVNAEGAETAGGTASDAVVVASKQITWTVAVDSSGVAVARNLYRTLNGGSTYYYIGTIADNTTTTFTDNIPDSSLVTELAANTFTLWYEYIPATLTGTDTPTQLPLKFHSQIPIYVKAQYMLRRGLHDEYARLMNNWAQIKYEVDNYVGHRDTASAQIVSIWEDGEGDDTDE